MSAPTQHYDADKSGFAVGRGGNFPSDPTIGTGDISAAMREEHESASQPESDARRSNEAIGEYSQPADSGQPSALPQATPVRESQGVARYSDDATLQDAKRHLDRQVISSENRRARPQDGSPGRQYAPATGVPASPGAEVSSGLPRDDMYSATAAHSRNIRADTTSGAQNELPPNTGSPAVRAVSGASDTGATWASVANGPGQFKTTGPRSVNMKSSTSKVDSRASKTGVKDRSPAHQVPFMQGSSGYGSSGSSSKPVPKQPDSTVTGQFFTGRPDPQTTPVRGVGTMPSISTQRYQPIPEPSAPNTIRPGEPHYESLYPQIPDDVQSDWQVVVGIDDTPRSGSRQPPAVNREQYDSPPPTHGSTGRSMPPGVRYPYPGQSSPYGGYAAQPVKQNPTVSKGVLRTVLLRFDNSPSELVAHLANSLYHVPLFGDQCNLDAIHDTIFDICSLLDKYDRGQKRMWDTDRKQLTALLTELFHLDVKQLPSPLALVLLVCKQLQYLNYDAYLMQPVIQILVDKLINYMSSFNLSELIPALQCLGNDANLKKYLGDMLADVAAQANNRTRVTYVSDLRLRLCLQLVYAESCVGAYSSLDLIVSGFRSNKWKSFTVKERTNILVDVAPRMAAYLRHMNEKNPQLTVELLRACSPLIESEPSSLDLIFRSVITPASLSVVPEITADFVRVSKTGWKSSKFAHMFNIVVVLSGYLTAGGGSTSHVLPTLYRPFLDAIFSYSTADSTWFNKFQSLKMPELVESVVRDYVLEKLLSEDTNWSQDVCKLLPGEVFVKYSSDLAPALCRFVCARVVRDPYILKLLDHFMSEGISCETVRKCLQLLLGLMPLSTETLCFALYCPRFICPLSADEVVALVVDAVRPRIDRKTLAQMASFRNLAKFERGNTASNLHHFIMQGIASILIVTPSERLTGKEALELCFSDEFAFEERPENVNWCLLLCYMYQFKLDSLCMLLERDHSEHWLPKAVLTLFFDERSVEKKHLPLLKDMRYFDQLYKVREMLKSMCTRISERDVTKRLASEMLTNWAALSFILERLGLTNELVAPVRNGPRVTPSDLVREFAEVEAEYGILRRVFIIIKNIKNDLIDASLLEKPEFDTLMLSACGRMLQSLKRRSGFGDAEYATLAYFVREDCNLFITLFGDTCVEVSGIITMNDINASIKYTLDKLRALMDGTATVGSVLKILQVAGGIAGRNSALYRDIECIGRYLDGSGPGRSYGGGAVAGERAANFIDLTRACLRLQEWYYFLPVLERFLDKYKIFPVMQARTKEYIERFNPKPLPAEDHQGTTEEAKTKEAPRQDIEKFSANEAQGLVRSIEASLDYALSSPEGERLSSGMVFHTLTEVHDLVVFLAEQTKNRRFEETLALLDSNLQGHTFNRNLLTSLRRTQVVLQKIIATQTHAEEVKWADITALADVLLYPIALKVVKDVHESLDSIKPWFVTGANINVEMSIPFIKTVLQRGRFRFRTQYHSDGPLLAIQFTNIDDGKLVEVDLAKINDLVAGIAVFMEKKSASTENSLAISTFQGVVALAKECFSKYLSLEQVGYFRYHSCDMIVELPAIAASAAGNITRLKTLLESEKLKVDGELAQWNDAMKTALTTCKRLLMLHPSTLASLMSCVASILSGDLSELTEDSFAAHAAVLEPYLWQCVPEINTNDVAGSLADQWQVFRTGEQVPADEHQKALYTMKVTANLVQAVMTELAIEDEVGGYHKPQLFVLPESIRVGEDEHMLLKLLYKINAGMPHPSCVLYCDSNTTKADVDHFLLKCKTFHELSFQVVHVSRLSVWERERLLDFVMAVQHDHEPVGELSLVFTQREGSSTFMFLGMQEISGLVRDEDLMLALGQSRAVTTLDVLCNPPLSGKTTYIRRQMDARPTDYTLTISINEDISICRIIEIFDDAQLFEPEAKGKSLSLHINLSGYSNMEHTNRFFELLVLHGLLLDEQSGLSRRVQQSPLFVYVEIGSVPLANDAGEATNIEKTLPVLGYCGVRVPNDKLSVYEVDDTARDLIGLLYMYCKKLLPVQVQEMEEDLLEDYFGDDGNVRTTLEFVWAHELIQRRTMYEKKAFTMLLVYFGKYLTALTTFCEGCALMDIVVEPIDHAAVMRALCLCARQLSEPKIDLHARLPLVPCISEGTSEQPPSLTIFHFNQGERDESLLRILAACGDMVMTRPGEHAAADVVDSFEGRLRAELAIGLGFAESNKLLPIVNQQSFVLTPDIAVKLLILHTRRMVGLNTVCSGETGLGKTEINNLNAVIANADKKIMEVGLDLLPNILRDLHQYCEQSVLSVNGAPIKEVITLFSGRLLTMCRGAGSTITNADIITALRTCLSQNHLTVGPDNFIPWQYVASKLVPFLRKYIFEHVLIPQTTPMISRLMTMEVEGQDMQPCPVADEVLEARDSAVVCKSADDVLILVQELLDVKFPMLFHRVLMNKTMTADEIRRKVEVVVSECEAFFENIKLRLPPVLKAKNTEMAQERFAEDYEEHLMSDEQIDAALDTVLDQLRFVLFVDEFNTSSRMGLMKEILSDSALDGKPLPKWLQIVGAMNPADRGVAAGRSGINTTGIKENDRRVYDVSDVPQSIESIMLQFNELTPEMEEDFLKAQFNLLTDLGNSTERNQLKAVILWGQQYTREMKVNVVKASIRDIQRCIQFYKYFKTTEAGKIMMEDYILDDTQPAPAQEATMLGRLYDNMVYGYHVLTRGVSHQHVFAAPVDGTPPSKRHWMSLVLAAALSYYFRSLNKDAFEMQFTQLMANLDSPVEFTVFVDVIRDFLTRFCRKIAKENGIAMTDYVKWNVFATMVCCDAKIPCGIIGPPGTSKTLSFAIATSNMNGQPRTALCKAMHHLQPFRCQLSKDSTDTEIANIYRNAIHQQDAMESDKKGTRSLAVVLLDEAGLPSQDRQPVKETHYYLDHPRVATVMLSNEHLDAAQNNRCCQVCLGEPTDKDLRELCKGILYGDEQAVLAQNTAEINNFVAALCDGYKEMNNWVLMTREGCFQLRDFTYFLRTLQKSFVVRGAFVSCEIILEALRRNFGGLDEESFSSMATNFFDVLRSHGVRLGTLPQDLSSSPISTLKASLSEKIAPHEDPNLAPFRYIMLIDPTDSLTSVSLLMDPALGLVNDVVVVSLGDFAEDATDEARTDAVVKIKEALAAPEPKTVILVNADKIHGNFYDLFNRHFVLLANPDGGRQCFAHIAVSSYSRPCEVNPNAKLVLHIPLSRIHTIPLPLLNRFEKYRLTVYDALTHFAPSIAWKTYSVSSKQGEMTQRNTLELVHEGCRDFINSLHLQDQRSKLLYGYSSQTLDSLLFKLVMNTKAAGRTDLVVPAPVSLPAVSASDEDKQTQPADELAELRQLIRKINYLLLQLSRPESVFMCRKLPSCYVKEVLLSQEHLSLIRLLKWLVKTKIELGSTEYTNKWILFTRTNGPVPSLHKNESLQSLVFADIAGVNKTCLKTMSLEMDTSIRCREEIQAFYKDSSKSVLLLVADMQSCTAEQVNFARREVDNARDDKKLVVFVLHFPPESVVSTHPCYDVVYMNAWDFAYVDSLGLTANNEKLPATHKDQELVVDPDARTWIAKAFGLKIEISTDSVSAGLVKTFLELAQESCANANLGFSAFGGEFYPSKAKNNTRSQRAKVLGKFLEKNPTFYQEAIAHATRMWSGPLLHALVLSTCEQLLEGKMSCGLLNAVFLSSRLLLQPVADEFVQLLCRDGNLMSITNMLVKPESAPLVHDLVKYAVRLIRFPSPRKLLHMTSHVSSSESAIHVAHPDRLAKLPFFDLICKEITDLVPSTVEPGKKRESVVCEELAKRRQLCQLIAYIDSTPALSDAFQQDYMMRVVSGVTLTDEWLGVATKIYRGLMQNYIALEGDFARSIVLQWVLGSALGDGKRHELFCVGLSNLTEMKPAPVDVERPPEALHAGVSSVSTYGCMLLWSRLSMVIMGTDKSASTQIVQKANGRLSDVIRNWVTVFGTFRHTILTHFREKKLFRGQERAAFNVMCVVHALCINCNRPLEPALASEAVRNKAMSMYTSPQTRDVGLKPSLVLLDTLITTMGSVPAKEAKHCLLELMPILMNTGPEYVPHTDQEFAYVKDDLSNLMELALSSILGQGLPVCRTLSAYNWLSIIQSCVLDKHACYLDVLLDAAVAYLVTVYPPDTYNCCPNVMKGAEPQAPKEKCELVVMLLLSASLSSLGLDALANKLQQLRDDKAKSKIRVAIEECAVGMCIIKVVASQLSGDVAHVVKGWREPVKAAIRYFTSGESSNCPVNPQLLLLSQIKSEAAVSQIMKTPEICTLLGLTRYAIDPTLSVATPSSLSKFVFCLNAPAEVSASLTPSEKTLAKLYSELVAALATGAVQDLVTFVTNCLANLGGVTKESMIGRIRMLLVLATYYEYFDCSKKCDVVKEALAVDGAGSIRKLLHINAKELVAFLFFADGPKPFVGGASTMKPLDYMYSAAARQDKGYDDADFGHYMANLLAITLGLTNSSLFTQTSMFDIGKLGSSVPASAWYNAEYWDCGFKEDGRGGLLKLRTDPPPCFDDVQVRLALSSIVWSALCWGCMLDKENGPAAARTNYHLLNYVDDIKQWVGGNALTDGERVMLYMQNRAHQFFDLLINANQSLQNYSVAHYMSEVLLKLWFACDCDGKAKPTACRLVFASKAEAVEFEQLFKTASDSVAAEYTARRTYRQQVAAAGDPRLGQVLKSSAAFGGYQLGQPAVWDLFTDMLAKNKQPNTFLNEYMDNRNKLEAIQCLPALVNLYLVVNSTMRRRVKKADVDSLTLSGCVALLKTTDQAAAAELEAALKVGIAAWSTARSAMGNFNICPHAAEENRGFEADIPELTLDSLLSILVTKSATDDTGNYLCKLMISQIAAVQKEILLRREQSVMNKLLIVPARELDVCRLSTETQGMLLSCGTNYDVTPQCVAQLMFEGVPASDGYDLLLVRSAESFTFDRDGITSMMMSHYSAGRQVLDVNKLQRIFVFSDSAEDAIVNSDSDDSHIDGDTSVPLWELKAITPHGRLTIASQELHKVKPELCKPLTEQLNKKLKEHFRESVDDAQLLDMCEILCALVKHALNARPGTCDRPMWTPDAVIFDVASNFLFMNPVGSNSLYWNWAANVPISCLGSVCAVIFKAYVGKEYLFADFGTMLKKPLPELLKVSIRSLKDDTSIDRDELKDALAELMRLLTQIFKSGNRGIKETDSLYAVVENRLGEKYRKTAKVLMVLGGDETNDVVLVCHTADFLECLFNMSIDICDEETEQLKKQYAPKTDHGRRTDEACYKENVPDLLGPTAPSDARDPSVEPVAVPTESECSSPVSVPAEQEHSVAPTNQVESYVPVPTGNGPVGLVNAACNCYLNAVVQCLYAASPLVGHVVQDRYMSGVAGVIATVFRTLQNRPNEAVDASSLVGELHKIHPGRYEPYKQEDANECLLDILKSLYDLSSGQLNGMLVGEVEQMFMCSSQTCGWSESRQHEQIPLQLVLQRKPDVSLQDLIVEELQEKGCPKKCVRCGCVTREKTAVKSHSPFALVTLTCENNATHTPFNLTKPVSVSGASYSILAVILHTGDSGGGHYRALVRSFDDCISGQHESWWTCNDSVSHATPCVDAERLCASEATSVVLVQLHNEEEEEHEDTEEQEPLPPVPVETAVIHNVMVLRQDENMLSFSPAEPFPGSLSEVVSICTSCGLLATDSEQDVAVWPSSSLSRLAVEDDQDLVVMGPSDVELVMLNESYKEMRKETVRLSGHTDTTSVLSTIETMMGPEYQVVLLDVDRYFKEQLGRSVNMCYLGILPSDESGDYVPQIVALCLPVPVTPPPSDEEAQPKEVLEETPTVQVAPVVPTEPEPIVPAAPAVAPIKVVPEPIAVVPAVTVTVITPQPEPEVPPIVPAQEPDDVEILPLVYVVDGSTLKLANANLEPLTVYLADLNKEMCAEYARLSADTTQETLALVSLSTYTKCVAPSEGDIVLVMPMLPCVVYTEGSQDEDLEDISPLATLTEVVDQLGDPAVDLIDANGQIIDLAARGNDSVLSVLKIDKNESGYPVCIHCELHTKKRSAASIECLLYGAAGSEPTQHQLSVNLATCTVGQVRAAAADVCGVPQGDKASVFVGATAGRVYPPSIDNAPASLFLTKVLHCYVVPWMRGTCSTLEFAGPSGCATVSIFANQVLLVPQISLPIPSATFTMWNVAKAVPLLGLTCDDVTMDTPSREYKMGKPDGTWSRLRGGMMNNARRAAVTADSVVGIFVDKDF